MSRRPSRRIYTSFSEAIEPPHVHVVEGEVLVGLEEGVVTGDAAVGDEDVDGLHVLKEGTARSLLTSTTGESSGGADGLFALSFAD